MQVSRALLGEEAKIDKNPKAQHRDPEGRRPNEHVFRRSRK